MFRKPEIDANNNLYAIGHTYGHYTTAEYQGKNPGPTGLTGDIVIQKFDKDLNRLAAVQFGPAHEDRGFGCVKHSVLYVAGMTEGGMVGSNLGSFDGFTVAFDTNDLTVKETTTFVKDQDVAPSRPDEFNLYQNYPNPFNPVTAIPFEMQQKGHVSLTVFNTAGQQVVQLLHGQMPAGRHIVTFNAHHLPGGLYLCGMQSPGNVHTIKLLLLK